MRIFTSVLDGRCAACEFEIPGKPVIRHEEAFCCLGCAGGAPCVCLYDEEQASDAVDGLGLPFRAAAEAIPAADAVPAPAPTPAAERELVASA